MTDPLAETQRPSQLALSAMPVPTQRSVPHSALLEARVATLEHQQGKTIHDTASAFEKISARLLQLGVSVGELPSTEALHVAVGQPATIKHLDGRLLLLEEQQFQMQAEQILSVTKQALAAVERKLAGTKSECLEGQEALKKSVEEDLAATKAACLKQQEALKKSVEEELAAMKLACLTEQQVMTRDMARTVVEAVKKSSEEEMAATRNTFADGLENLKKVVDKQLAGVSLAHAEALEESKAASMNKWTDLGRRLDLKTTELEETMRRIQQNSSELRLLIDGGEELRRKDQAELARGWEKHFSETVASTSAELSSRCNELNSLLESRFTSNADDLRCRYTELRSLVDQREEAHRKEQAELATSLQTQIAQTASNRNELQSRCSELRLLVESSEEVRCREQDILCRSLKTHFSDALASTAHDLRDHCSGLQQLIQSEKQVRHKEQAGIATSLRAEIDSEKQLRQTEEAELARILKAHVSEAVMSTSAECGRLLGSRCNELRLLLDSAEENRRREQEDLADRWKQQWSEVLATAQRLRQEALEKLSLKADLEDYTCFTKEAGSKLEDLKSASSIEIVDIGLKLDEFRSAVDSKIEVVQEQIRQLRSTAQADNAILRTRTDELGSVIIDLRTTTSQTSINQLEELRLYSKNNYEALADAVNQFCRDLSSSILACRQDLTALEQNLQQYTLGCDKDKKELVGVKESCRELKEGFVRWEEDLNELHLRAAQQQWAHRLWGYTMPGSKSLGLKAGVTAIRAKQYLPTDVRAIADKPEELSSLTSTRPGSASSSGLQEKDTGVKAMTPSPPLTLPKWKGPPSHFKTDSAHTDPRSKFEFSVGA